MKFIILTVLIGLSMLGIRILWSKEESQPSSDDGIYYKEAA